VVLVLATIAGAQSAQQSAAFEQAMEHRTTVKVLPNGLTLVISERHEAPVFSFYTLVNAGSANDPQGESGLAHMFEHIAFKGTTRSAPPTTRRRRSRWPRSKPPTPPTTPSCASAWVRTRQAAGGADAKFEDGGEAAQVYVIPNQFSEIAESNGAVGLNASTAEDSTQYFWSMPSNRLELWAYLESSRIGWPVAREFYKERDVVNEERRMRIDSSPQGRMVEEFLAAAYMAHPLWRSRRGLGERHQPGHGDRSGGLPQGVLRALEHRRRRGGRHRYQDSAADAGEVLWPHPAGPAPQPMTTVEPPQHALRTVVLHEASQPIYIEGYHRPDYRSPDDATYSAITDIFSDGRTSRLYRSLVRDQRIAVAAEGFSGFPGVKYPGLFAFYAVPMSGHTAEEMGDAIHKELDKLKTEDVSDAELERFKARARAALLQSLGDNEGLASQLADYQTRFGDWREMFRELKEIDAVSKADIRRVAQQTFVEDGRTVARIEFKAPAPPPGTAPPPASSNKGGAR
jgi:predicted Zn-dependent peptidase